MIRGTTVLGVGSSAGPLLEKREKGAPPVIFRYRQKKPALYSLVKLAHAPNNITGGWQTLKRPSRGVPFRVRHDQINYLARPG